MKDGDLLLEKLRQAAKRRNDIVSFIFTVKHERPWWYWLDWQKVNHN